MSSAKIDTKQNISATLSVYPDWYSFVWVLYFIYLLQYSDRMLHLKNVNIKQRSCYCKLPFIIVECHILMSALTYCGNKRSVQKGAVLYVLGSASRMWCRCHFCRLPVRERLLCQTGRQHARIPSTKFQIHLPKAKEIVPKCYKSTTLRYYVWQLCHTDLILIRTHFFSVLHKHI